MILVKRGATLLVAGRAVCARAAPFAASIPNAPSARDLGNHAGSAIDHDRDEASTP
jgi:hypothetical protein